MSIVWDLKKTKQEFALKRHRELSKSGPEPRIFKSFVRSGVGRAAAYLAVPLAYVIENLASGRYVCAHFVVFMSIELLAS